MQIAGHTFLVTGGASGLGAATARKLAAPPVTRKVWPAICMNR